MKQKLLAFIAANPLVSLDDIRLHMKTSSTAVSVLLTTAYANKEIDFQRHKNNKKCYFIPQSKPVVVVEAYVVERTLHRVKEIPSIFAYQ